jgi:hypothetical protein
MSYMSFLQVVGTPHDSQTRYVRDQCHHDSYAEGQSDGGAGPKCSRSASVAQY